MTAQPDIAPSLTVVRSRRLFDITTDIARVAEAADAYAAEEGAEDDLLAEADAVMATLGVELESKVDGYCAVIAERETRRDALRATAQAMLARAQREEDVAEKLRERLKAGLEAIGRTRVEAPRWPVRVQRNGGKVPLIEGERPEALPPELVRADVRVEGLRDDVHLAALAAWVRALGGDVRATLHPDKEAIRRELESRAEVQAEVRAEIEAAGTETTWQELARLLDRAGVPFMVTAETAPESALAYLDASPPSIAGWRLGERGTRLVIG